MANSRIQLSSIKQGFPKSRSMLAGNPAYDPAATFLIQRITATGGESSLSFTSIPSTYKHLQIRGLSLNQAVGTGNQNILLRFNSDTGTNYTRHFLRGDGTSANAFGSTGLTGIYVQDSDLVNNTSSLFRAASIIDIANYSSTTNNKTVRSFAGQDMNSNAYGLAVALSSGVWLNTNAITTVSLLPQGGIGTFASGSTFALYGFTG